jgi:DNA (cytosine-5)-methyltransferase 1
MTKKIRKKKARDIAVIDLFAGPGGLGEGFGTWQNQKSGFPFDVRLSIEMEMKACETLKVRHLHHALMRRRGGRTLCRELYLELLSNGMDSAIEKFHDIWEEERIEDTVFRHKMEDDPLNREKTTASIRDALRGHNGPKVVIGGPPCKTYSSAGKSRMSKEKKNKKYDPKKDPRNFLYKEYLHCLREVQPEIFVMENVQGMLSSEIEDQKLFENMCIDFSEEGLDYEVRSFVTDIKGEPWESPRDYLVRCEEYGVPQARHRVILLGVRRDLNIEVHNKLKKSPQVRLRDAIGGMPPYHSGVTRIKEISVPEKEGQDRFKDVFKNLKTKKWISELAKTDPGLKRKVLATAKELTSKAVVKGKFLKSQKASGKAFHKIIRGCLSTKDGLHGQIYKVPRRHMDTDLERYLYVACFLELKKRSPKLRDFPKSLLPDHDNVKVEKDLDTHADRFRAHSPDRTAHTITCHISKDGHANIHPDPYQVRALSLREAARIQSFPDDYWFSGGKTSGLEQVGNAVPPLVARQMAGIVYEMLSEVTK